MTAKRMMRTHCGRRTVIGAINGDSRGPVSGGSDVRSNIVRLDCFGRNESSLYLFYVSDILFVFMIAFLVLSHLMIVTALLLFRCHFCYHSS